MSTYHPYEGDGRTPFYIGAITAAFWAAVLAGAVGVMLVVSLVLMLFGVVQTIDDMLQRG